jgi:hypothetical protein
MRIHYYFHMSKILNIMHTSADLTHNNKVWRSDTYLMWEVAVSHPHQPTGRPILISLTAVTKLFKNLFHSVSDVISSLIWHRCS